MKASKAANERIRQRFTRPVEEATVGTRELPAETILEEEFPRREVLPPFTWWQNALLSIAAVLIFNGLLWLVFGLKGLIFGLLLTAFGSKATGGRHSLVTKRYRWK